MVQCSPTVSELSTRQEGSNRIEPPGIATNHAPTPWLTTRGPTPTSPTLAQHLPNTIQAKPLRSHTPIVSVRKFLAKSKLCPPLLNSIHRPHYPTSTYAPSTVAAEDYGKHQARLSLSSITARSSLRPNRRCASMQDRLFYCFLSNFSQTRTPMHTIFLGALVRPEHLQLPNNMAR